MRKYLETLITNPGIQQLGEMKFHGEELVIDWKDTKTISIRGRVLVQKDVPISKELKRLTFREEVDSVDKLLIKLIGAMYRFDVPASRVEVFDKLAIELNDVFRHYPLEYYEKVKLHNHNPWLIRKQLLDLYIYSKLATNKIWKDWSDSDISKDRIWLHKPKDWSPFTVVFQKDYLWGDD